MGGAASRTCAPCSRPSSSWKRRAATRPARRARCPPPACPVAIVNPRQVRDFAKALGLLEKTDAIDAAVLAAFAARIQPTPRPLPDDLQADLQALVTRRRQLVDMLTAERNRVPLARGAVRKNLRGAYRLAREAAGQDRSRPAHADRGESAVARARSAAAIGPRHRAGDLGLPAGLLARARHADPPPDQQTRGRRPLARRQRPPPRLSSHPEAGVATSAPPCTWRPSPPLPTIRPIRAAYRRWRAAGKLPKVALVAAMHKLLIHLNAMLKHQTAWHPISTAPTA